MNTSSEDYQVLSIEERGALAAAKLDDLRKQINAGPWTEHIETLLKEWAEKAAGLRFMHNAASSYWTKHGNNLTMMSIIISTLASGTSLIATSIDDNDTKNVVMYAVGAVGLLSSTIQAFKKFYNSEEKAADHAVSAKAFGSFYRYMVLQLGLSPSDRMPSDKLCDYVLKEYERMQQDARPISSREISMFKAKFDSKVQAFPDICETDYAVKVFRARQEEAASAVVGSSAV